MTLTDYMSEEKEKDSVKKSMRWLEDNMKTNYNHQIQNKQHKDQQNNNNQKTKMGMKIIVSTFWVTNKWHFTREDLEVAKWNLKRETESLLKATQNNAIRTNYIIAKINQTEQNSICGLYGDRD